MDAFLYYAVLFVLLYFAAGGLTWALWVYPQKAACGFEAVAQVEPQIAALIMLEVICFWPVDLYRAVKGGARP